MTPTTAFAQITSLRDRPALMATLVALLTLSLSTSMSQGAFAQDADDAPVDDTSAAEADAADEEDSVADDSLLLPGGIFTPSEKIEADSEVSLPSDI